uniref:Uncharacterized protein n=1 Tax=Noctiluca scintillans TaxID=2966 RepID=A0A7S1FKL1_NOCSC
MEARFHPRDLATRELDGIEFPITVLRRVTCQCADVLFLDDGNIECGVPVGELLPPDTTGVVRGQEEFESLWSRGVAQLTLMDDLRNSRPATAVDMRWEQGRYVSDDGATILSACETNLVMNSDAACGAGLRGIQRLRQSRISSKLST